jgi:NAD(P)H-hydrate epimerase
MSGGGTGKQAVLSVAEMYRADRGAIEAGVPGAELMDAAGSGIAEEIRARWQPCAVTVLCGPGNNGGDGFVIARRLSEAGWSVRLALLGEPAALKGDAAHHAGLWAGPVEALEPQVLDDAGLVVDALFGAGLSRPLEGAAAAVVERLAGLDAAVVAVDMPSGVSGDDGQPLGETFVRAELTVTFFRKKPGHLLLPGRLLCGETVVIDIGIPDAVLEEIAPQGFENAPALWRAAYPWRQVAEHKYDHGHLLVVGGPVMTGAARLAGRAALRVGAGLVTLAAEPQALAVYQLASPSLIVVGIADAEAFAQLTVDPRKNAFLIGPGAGVSETTRRMVLAALATGRAVLLDADALTVFADDPQALFSSVAGSCVLTPHDGEFKRLFPDLAGDRLTRARVAAARSGCVVVLKGPDTIIAAPDGRAAINANAPPELATAGTGDVLAGLIAGLLAQKMPAWEAACAAVWLHGECGKACGPGLISDDLPEALPEILRRLR